MHVDELLWFMLACQAYSVNLPEIAAKDSQTLLQELCLPSVRPQALRPPPPVSSLKYFTFFVGQAMHFKKFKIQRFKSLSYFSKNSFNVRTQVPLTRPMSPLAGLGLRRTGPRPSTCKATSSVHETCMHYVSIRIIYIESSYKDFSYIVQQCEEQL